MEYSPRLGKRTIVTFLLSLLLVANGTPLSPFHKNVMALVKKFNVWLINLFCKGNFSPLNYGGFMEFLSFVVRVHNDLLVWKFVFSGISMDSILRNKLINY